MSIVYCCHKSCHKLRGLKQQPFMSSSFTWVKSLRAIRLSLFVCSGFHKTKVKLLGEKVLLRAFRFLTELRSRKVKDRDPHFLSGCQPGGDLNSQRTHPSPWIWPFLSQTSNDTWNRLMCGFSLMSLFSAFPQTPLLLHFTDFLHFQLLL